MRVKDIRLSNTHGLNSRARAMGGTATTGARAGTVADIKAMEVIRDIRGIRGIKDIMGMEDGTNSGSPGRSHNGAGVPTTTA